MANELTVQQQQEVALAEARKLGFDPQENFDGGEKPELPIIKIKSQGQVFELPDGSKVESFEGILLYKHRCNVLWAPGENTKEILCQSVDAVQPCGGKHIQSKTCDVCPMNQFGSDVNDRGEAEKGKACKNQIRSFWIIKGQKLPVIMMIPPTSLKSFSRYITTLSSGVDIGDGKMEALHYCQAVAQCTLEGKSEGSREWSILHVDFDRMVKSVKTLERLKELREKFMQQFAAEIREKELDDRGPDEVKVSVVEDEPNEDGLVGPGEAPDPTPAPKPEAPKPEPKPDPKKEAPKKEAPAVSVEADEEDPF